MLELLAAFEGSFALDAAEWVAVEAGLDVESVGAALAGLVARGELERVPGRDRWRLLLSIAPSVAARRLHLDWCWVFAAGVDEWRGSPSASAWAARLDDERANIDTALAFAASAEGTEADRRVAADLVRLLG